MGIDGDYGLQVNIKLYVIEILEVTLCLNYIEYVNIKLYVIEIKWIK